MQETERPSKTKAISRKRPKDASSRSVKTVTTRTPRQGGKGLRKEPLRSKTRDTGSGEPKQSAAEQDAIFAAQNDAVLLYDTEMNVRKANPAFAAIYGFDPAGLNVREIVKRVSCCRLDGRPFDMENQPTPRALQGERVTGALFRVTRGDGSEAVVETSSAPILTGGRITGSVTVWHDITGLMRAEATTRTILQRFFAILSSIHSAILLVDKDDRIEYANQAFCDYFALPDKPADLIGLTAMETTARIKGRYLHPDREVARIREIVEKGEQVRDEEIAMRDGRTCLRDFIPVRIAGELHGRLWHHYDITERKQTEEALKESEERYRTVADFTYDWEFLLGPDGRFSYISPSAERIVGRRIAMNTPADEWLRQIVHPEDLDKRLLHLKEELEGRGPSELEFRIVRPDGDVRWLHHVCQPIHDDQGVFLGIRGSNRDITERRHTDETLRETRRRLETLVDSISDGFYALDRDWRFAHVNDAALSHMGLTREDVLGRTIFDILPGFRGSTVEEEYRRAINSREPRHFENPSLVSGRLLEIHAYPGRDMMSVIFRDVTEQERMAAALRESEARYRLLADTAGRLLRSEDPQAIVEDLCRGVMAHLDCQTFFNFLLDERKGRLHLNACAGISREEAHAIEWLDFGVAVCGCVARDAQRIIAEDIMHTPDERTELVKSYGIQAYCCHPLMAQDRLIGTLSFGTKTRPHFTPEEVEVMRTVADQVAVAMQRKQAERYLQEANDELERRVTERTQELQAASVYTRRLIETNLDPLVTISAEGKITDVNAATELATGRSRSELLGSDFSDYFTEPEKARIGYTKVFLEGFVRDYPLAIRHRSGRITEVLYNASVYKNERGDILGVFAAARDVTELRQAQHELHQSYAELERRVEERTADLKVRTEQLEAANKELESFSYSISHDLRAPLRAIDGYARMLLKKHGDSFDEESARRFNTIRTNAQMMGQLIDDLLSFSRLSRARLSLADLDMTSLIAEVWGELTENIERRPEFLCDGIPPCMGDRTLIRQVLSNLLSNAVKFSSKNDRACIEMGGRRHGNENVYYVRDNGVGFDMQYHDKLFGVFQRLHGADEFEGTGVGLAIVQRIVHRHGGRVWAESKENEGAIFYFSLPVSDTKQDPSWDRGV
jgi:PAS domain S-box-containing protein